MEEIWDSIAAESAAVPLTTPQRDKLDRRFADHAAHPEVLSWDEVKASLDERLKKSRCASPNLEPRRNLRDSLAEEQPGALARTRRFPHCVLRYKS